MTFKPKPHSSSYTKKLRTETRLRSATYSNSITPSRISPDIRAVCAELDPAYEPRYLKVTPVKGAIQLQCHDNVSNHIESHGGKQQCGWTLLEDTNGILAAYVHSVWVGDDGQLVDITPDTEDTNLFLPSSSPVLYRSGVKAIFRAITDDPTTVSFVARLTKEEEIQTAIEQALRHILANCEIVPPSCEGKSRDSLSDSP
jgi:hypothetical protein